MNRVSMMIAAGAAGLMCTSVASAASVGYEFEITGHPNAPIFELTNVSSAASEIVGMTLTIGDINHNFDRVLTQTDDQSIIGSTLVEGDEANQGGRVDRLGYDFTGFSPSESFLFQVDLDADGRDTVDDWRQVMIDQAVLNVLFSTGQRLTNSFAGISQTARTALLSGSQEINGAIVAPTPSAAALGLMLMGGLGLRRSRKQA